MKINRLNFSKLQNVSRFFLLTPQEKSAVTVVLVIAMGRTYCQVCLAEVLES